MSEQDVVFRGAEVEDACVVAGLSAELGYPVPENEIADRLRAYHDDPSRCVMVAQLGERVVGWVDAGVVSHLQSGRYGEIGGLVVASDLRGRGIGKGLLAEAEAWMRRLGVSQCVVRSRSTRLDAHRFYEREGWALEKTSAVFRKTL